MVSRVTGCDQDESNRDFERDQCNRHTETEAHDPPDLRSNRASARNRLLSVGNHHWHRSRVDELVRHAAKEHPGQAR